MKDQFKQANIFNKESLIELDENRQRAIEGGNLYPILPLPIGPIILWTIIFN